MRRDGDAVVWTLQQHLHALLLDLLEQLDVAIDGPVDHPVVHRLFPRAVEGEDEADRELRLLLAGDLLLRRHEAIATCREVLAAGHRAGRGRVRVRLEEELPGMLLAVLNDVRLALGASVGETAVELRQLVEDDDTATQWTLEVMDLLAWFQMQLLEQIDPVSARHDDVDG